LNIISLKFLSISSIDSIW